MQFKRQKGLSLAAVVAAAAFLVMGTDARALTYGFSNISANSIANAAAGEEQLSVDITAEGLHQVLFTFHNEGPAASSITDVYFDSDSLLSIHAISGSSGVQFSLGATPGNLPSANNASPFFETGSGLSADSDPPVQLNGVNPGEWLGILFDMKSGVSFDDIVQDLLEGSLRIGIHVQGFVGGGSESFVSPENRHVPDAGSSFALLGLALLGLGSMARNLRRL